MGEWDFAEQTAAGEELNAELTDHEKMCQHYGIEDWSALSNRERSDYRWNWNKFGRKEGA
jgi:hypothetical protein